VACVAAKAQAMATALLLRLARTGRLREGRTGCPWIERRVIRERPSLVACCGRVLYVYPSCSFRAASTQPSLARVRAFTLGALSRRPCKLHETARALSTERHASGAGTGGRDPRAAVADSHLRFDWPAASPPESRVRRVVFSSRARPLRKHAPVRSRKDNVESPRRERQA
jgi:hypothetical protein